MLQLFFRSISIFLSLGYIAGIFLFTYSYSSIACVFVCLICYLACLLVYTSACLVICSTYSVCSAACCSIASRSAAVQVDAAVEGEGRVDSVYVPVDTDSWYFCCCLACCLACCSACCCSCRCCC